MDTIGDLWMRTVAEQIWRWLNDCMDGQMDTWLKIDSR